MLTDKTKDMARPTALFPVMAIAIVTLCPAASSFADTLDFKGTTVSEAANRIHKTFGATLELKKGIDLRRKVTFSVENTGGDGALLEAVNSLANAVNADYQKVFIIAGAPVGAVVSDPAIDAASAPVVFSSATLPAAKAIAVIAGVDDATAQMSNSLDTPITLSGTSLNAGEAARQIARQTHTEWKIEYVLTPHTAQGSLPGKIIGYTGAGSPILEMPSFSFRTQKPASVQPKEPTQAALFWSAIRRGDRSAMRMFQPHGDVSPSNTPPAPESKP